MKYISTVIITFFLFFVYVSECFAASISITGGQTSISSNDEYSVSVTLSINNDTDYYLRGVFHKPNTDSYCGYTWNGSSWFKGPYTNGGWTNFLKITTKNNSWNGQLKVKIDPTDSECNTGGTYNFKIERFTQAGTENSDIQTEQTVQVVIPTALSVSLTPSFSSTPSLTPFVIEPTSFITSFPSPTVSDQNSNTNSSSNNSDSTATPTSTSQSIVTSAPNATITEDPQSVGAPNATISEPRAINSTVSGMATITTPATNTSVLGLQLEPTSSGLSNDNPGLPAKKGIPSGIWYLLFMGAVLIMAGCGIVLFQIKKRK